MSTFHRKKEEEDIIHINQRTRRSMTPGGRLNPAGGNLTYIVIFLSFPNLLQSWFVRDEQHYFRVRGEFWQNYVLGVGRKVNLRRLGGSSDGL